MDAGDWIRLKRLQGMNFFEPKKANKNPSVNIEPHTGRKVYTEFGTSKIRMPASFWIDNVASYNTTYILESGGAGTKSLVGTRLCDCLLTSDPVKHNPRCTKCGR